MAKKSDQPKKYSNSDLEKIRKRASEIWKGKCQALNTALDDWLQAERELKSKIGIENKKPDEYTKEQIAKIRERAEAVRQEKIGSLRTAFNDWIEAEAELKDELKKKIALNDFFDLWFSKVSSEVSELLKTDSSASMGSIDEILGKNYVELMKECMK